MLNSLFKIQGKKILDMFIPATFHSKEEKTLSICFITNMLQII